MKKDYWLFILALASWGAIILLIPKLPPLIPMHWGINGQVDRWGDRINIIWLGALGLLIWILMTWMPAIDPRRDNYRHFGKSYRILRGVIVALMIGLSWITVIFSMNENIDVALFLKIIIGITFIVIGNLLTRIRPNWFAGIKTPWTLADPVIWKKTHRIGGYLMVSSGVIFILSGILLPGTMGFWIPITVLIGGVIFDVVYSAVLWKKLHGNNSIH